MGVGLNGNKQECVFMRAFVCVNLGVRVRVCVRMGVGM